MQDIHSHSILEGYVTPLQLAKEIGVTLRTLSRWEALRIGPPRTVIGRKIFYKTDSVRAWLDAPQQRWAKRRK